MIENVVIKNQVALVHLRGALDVARQKALKEGLADVIEKQEKDLVLDFSGVNFIDSSCLGALVATAKKLRDQRGDLKLARLTDDVRSIFQITRLDKVFEIFDDTDAAIESFFK